MPSDFTRQLLESRGFAMQPDGSFSKPGSHAVEKSRAVSDSVETTKRVDPPAKREPSAGEAKFLALWTELKGPVIEAEHRFAKPRRWRFDFACVLARVAIEVEGLTHQGGRHQRIGGYKNDCEKYFEATALGWTVFRLTSNLITAERVGRIIEHCCKNV